MFAWVSVFIFLRHTNLWLHRQFSSAQFRNEEMMGDVWFAFGATAAGC